MERTFLEYVHGKLAFEKISLSRLEPKRLVLLNETSIF